MGEVRHFQEGKESRRPEYGNFCILQATISHSQVKGQVKKHIDITSPPKSYTYNEFRRHMSAHAHEKKRHTRMHAH